MVMKNSVCFIINYFGNSFPKYFKYFLYSASFNNSIDFLIFSDIKYAGSIPSNVKIVLTNKKNISNKISHLVGKKIKLTNAYKLCDIKPAYGILFEDELKNYDYWGHCDIDIIWGDVRKFIDPLLEEYDYISARQEFTAGFFSIYKNNNSLRSIFKSSKDWKKVFSDQKHYAFDECNFVYNDLVNGSHINSLETEIVSMTSILKNQSKCFFKTICHEFLFGEQYDDELVFNNGSLYSSISNKEYPFVHLYNTKDYDHYYYGKIEPGKQFFINKYCISSDKALKSKIIQLLFHEELRVDARCSIEENCEENGRVFVGKRSCKFHSLAQNILNYFEFGISGDEIIYYSRKSLHENQEKFNILKENVEYMITYGLSRYLLNVVNTDLFHSRISEVEM